MTPEELQNVLEWCREHPSGTLEEAQKHFFPDAAQYVEYTWVHLRYACMHASTWEEKLLLTDLQYELLSEHGEVRLGEIDGKHSDVHAEWREIEAEVLTDPLEIAAKMREGNTVHGFESDVLSQKLAELEDAYDHFMSRSYLRKRLDKFFPPGPNRKKPNTDVQHSVVNTNTFTSKRFQKLIESTCERMHKKGLYNTFHAIWQQRMVEFVDETFGGTSAVLSQEQPWWEL